MAFYFLLRIAMVLQLAVVVDANNFTNNSNSNINNSTNGIVWSNGNGTNSGNSTNATGGVTAGNSSNQFVPDHPVMVRDFLLLILLVGLVPGFCCYRLNKLNNDDNTTNNHIDRTEQQQQQPQQQQREVRKESAAQRKEFVKTQLPVRILQEKDVLLSSSNKRGGLEDDNNKSDDGDTEEEEDDDLDDVELGGTRSGHSNRSLANGGSRRNVLNRSPDKSAKNLMIGITGGTSHADDTNETRATAIATAATAAAVVASNDDMSSSSSPDTNLISSIRESFARLGSSGSTGGIVALASSCRPMATAAALSSSSQWSVMSGTRPVCSICLSGYHRGDEVSCATNPHCPHVFHHECIESWLYNHDECPNCRQEFLLRPPATTTTTEATTKEPTITTEAAATEPTATTTITTEAATNNNTTPVLLSPPIFISQV